MRSRFFSRTDAKSRHDFRMYYVLQNLVTIRAVSLIYLALSLVIRFFIIRFHSGNNDPLHLEDYEVSNVLSIILLPLFYFGSRQLIGLFKADNKYANAIQVFVFLFAMFVIINTMHASFYNTHEPRNAMVMYLIGLVVVGVFFTFELYGIIFITALTGFIFAFWLSFYQHDLNELVVNNLASLILLTCFFTISKFAFSYRADNFFKLRAIEEKNTEIEKASQLKNEILGVVAHDLRDPLASIRTLASLMEIDVNMDADNRDNLHMIKQSCDKATSIINDLLETAHSETAITEFELERVDLNKFLLLIVDEWLKNKKYKANILYYGTKHNVHALINKEKMQRAMDNLISNAVKFSAANDHIEVTLKEASGEAFIDIKDLGVGIPEQMQPYIFDRFSKASRKGVRGEESVGLGLSIVQEIIRKHGGEITVKSNPDKGTTFTIKLGSIS